MTPSLGLRIDVDTFRGTRKGVPNLCRILKKHGIQGTFFFSVGPDNMGRHLRRLIHPKFLLKMLRSNGAKLYGLDILIRGTLWPGPIISKKLGDVIHAAADAGHEIGLHAWDHHYWQSKLDWLQPFEIKAELDRGFDAFRNLGVDPVCTAAPAWMCTNETLNIKEDYPLKYNSDCRGKHLFVPKVDKTALSTPQIPVTLPTFDEVIGQNGITEETYNDYLINLLNPDELNVLTIHAEAEGIAYQDLFDDFLKEVLSKGYEVLPLGDLLNNDLPIPPCRMVKQEIPGRQGWVSVQE